MDEVIETDPILIAQLRRDEGVRSHPYMDTVGKLTIGVGRNLDDVGLSDDEIDYLLANDIKRASKGLLKALPWVSSLDPVRRRVLVNMAFNLGVQGLLGFKNTLRMIEHGNYEGAAEGMLNSKWARQVGKRSLRLAKAMRTGIDQ